MTQKVQRKSSKRRRKSTKSWVNESLDKQVKSYAVRRGLSPQSDLQKVSTSTRNILRSIRRSSDVRPRSSPLTLKQFSLYEKSYLEIFSSTEFSAIVTWREYL